LALFVRLQFVRHVRGLFVVRLARVRLQQTRSISTLGPLARTHW